MSTTNATPTPDDHAPPGRPDPAIIARGHEADGYDTVSVVSVPLMVIGFFVLAFAVTTTIFWYVTTNTSPDEGTPHPAAAARNSAPINERMGRIHRGGEVDQPRLEPLVLREEGSMSYPRAPLAQGNSPQIHPEQLRVNKDNTPALYKTGWVDQGKKIARISIDDAMKIAAEKGVLKSAANETRAVSSQHVPTAANAGRGAEGSKVEAPNAKAESKKEKEKH